MFGETLQWTPQQSKNSRGSKWKLLFVACARLCCCTWHIKHQTLGNHRSAHTLHLGASRRLNPLLCTWQSQFNTPIYFNILLLSSRILPQFDFNSNSNRISLSATRAKPQIKFISQVRPRMLPFCKKIAQNITDLRIKYVKPFVC